LALVEDGAHAPGASLEGRAAGAWGDAGCFSFFSNKNMTTGEGGMITTARDDVAAKARLLRSHGMTTLTLDRHRGHAFVYDVEEAGFNYRMGEINAALGLVQLARLGERNERRRALVQRYRSRLSGDPQIGLPFQAARGQPAHHIMPVLLPNRVDRIRVMAALRDSGVQTSVHYRSVDTFRGYVDGGLGPCEYLRRTHRIADAELTLPLYPSLEFEAVDFVCEALLHAVPAGRLDAHR
jgi:dTDP-4-amino-4,6-dideoxygalactose transaminase